MKKNKEIFILSDTHFFHTQKMMEYCDRPNNYNEILWKNLRIIGDNDILIHLGDICIGHDTEVHEMLSKYKFRKILVRGNHDRKTNNWYLEHGWDFVCDSFSDNLFGKNLLFSHMPKAWNGVYDLNLHGHFHNSTNRPSKPEFVSIKDDRQILYACEYENYLPVRLEKFINRK